MSLALPSFLLGFKSRCGSLDVIQTVGRLFGAKELVHVKQDASSLAGTCCIYELGIVHARTVSVYTRD